MKEILLILGVFVPSLLPAQAVLPEGSLFDQGNEAFRTANMPTPVRLYGWYSGRCVSATRPHVKVAALLTTYLSSYRLKSLFWSDRKKPEDFFDHLTPDAVREIETALREGDSDTPVLNPRWSYWEAIHLGAHKDSTKTINKPGSVAFRKKCTREYRSGR